MQDRPATHDHRRRGNCSVANCPNQAYARQLCCRHGAKKQCSVNGCSLRARLNDVCFKHGAQKKHCVEEGCTQPAQARRRCVRHGGGRHCKVVGCFSHSRVGGLCQRHRLPGSSMEAMDAEWNRKLPTSHSNSIADDAYTVATSKTDPEAPWLLCAADPIKFIYHEGWWSDLTQDDNAMMHDILDLLQS